MKFKIGLILILFAYSFILQASDSIILPPMPLEAENSKNVTGIDINNNDVRDDVEIFIYNHISKNIEEYYAFLQYARGHQRYLKFYPDIQKLKANEKNKNLALDCFKILGTERFDTPSLNKITSLTFNTDERKAIRKAYGPLSHKISATFVLKDKRQIKKDQVCTQN